jgi:hypothetical protein
MTEWSLQVSDETDMAIKQYLSTKDIKDLSGFVEEAVNAYLFDLTVTQIKERNSHENQQEIMDIVDEAVEWSDASRS